MMKKSRNVNMDLLRIVSMLLIVFLHSIDHSGVLENAENCGMAMYFYVRFTYMLCQVCVNSYVMLSGYFLVTSKFRLKKLVTLWMEAAFYSVVIRLIFMLAGARPFSIVSLVSCFAPILTGRYKAACPAEYLSVRSVQPVEFHPSQHCRHEFRRRLGTGLVCGAVPGGSLVAALL